MISTRVLDSYWLILSQQLQIILSKSRIYSQFIFTFQDVIPLSINPHIYWWRMVHLLTTIVSEAKTLPLSQLLIIIRQRTIMLQWRQKHTSWKKSTANAGIKPRHPMTSIQRADACFRADQDLEIQNIKDQNIRKHQPYRLLRSWDGEDCCFFFTNAT